MSFNSARINTTTPVEKATFLREFAERFRTRVSENVDVISTLKKNFTDDQLSVIITESTTPQFSRLVNSQSEKQIIGLGNRILTINRSATEPFWSRRTRGKLYIQLQSTLKIKFSQPNINKIIYASSSQQFQALKDAYDSGNVDYFFQIASKILGSIPK